MKNKQIAWYLIFVGLAIFLIEFVTTILAFIGNHPLLGLACLIMLIGIFLLAYDD
tara:strand:+ start:632 stop:796 length:165 start_codon:yes stop_codon:yes gene_type:complete